MGYVIFYFTGTGNSLYAASAIGDAQGEQLISIPAEMDRKQAVYSYEQKDSAVLGFVFPVYAWGPPAMVLEFIKKLRVTGKPYVFSLCTCGDEEGQATRLLRKSLEGSGMVLNSSFTLKMPNNYVVGFDVDPKELEERKLKEAEGTLREINGIISRRESVHRNIPGSFPGLKTRVVNPLFNRFAMDTKKFYADDKCISCGLCEKVCPVHTIKVETKPVWGKECTQCLACIHRCPVNAIQMGKGTEKKGRYLHPDLQRLENSSAVKR
jgi:NAD-dependent dihydropyrimidine dehydrogenase PreA subunit